VSSLSFAPPGLCCPWTSRSHGLRRGLHSFAASRLGLKRRFYSLISDAALEAPLFLGVLADEIGGGGVAVAG